MMAYSNSYVSSILVKDRPVREFSEDGNRACIVPFGSEYKIRLKNKTNKRCKAKVFIDGMDTNADGGSFVLNAGQTFDLERFVESLKSGNKFKFISLEEGKRTGEIQDPTSTENGLIRVEFHPESNYWNSILFTQTTSPATPTIFANSLGEQGIQGINGTIINSCYNNYSTSTLATTNSVQINCNKLEETKGATVQGGQSSQSFATVSDFVTDAPTIITLRIRGPKSELSEIKEMEEKLNQFKILQDELKDELKKRVQPDFEVVLKHNLIFVKLNGVDFTSSKETTIGISDEGLTIKGKGMDIKTKNYKLVTG